MYIYILRYESILQNTHSMFLILMRIAPAIEKLRYTPWTPRDPPLRDSCAMTRPVRGLISLVATWQWNVGKAALDAQIITDPGSFCESQYLRCSQSPC
jgi:hypothetical protein